MIRAIGWAAVALGIGSQVPTAEAIGVQGAGFRIGQDGSRYPLTEDRAPVEHPAVHEATAARNPNGGMERFEERRSQSKVGASSGRLRGGTASTSKSSDFAGSTTHEHPNTEVQPAFKVARSLGIDTLKDETSFKERIASMKSSKAGSELLNKMAARVQSKGLDNKESAQFAGLLHALKSNLDIADEESKALYAKVKATCAKSEKSADAQIKQLEAQMVSATAAKDTASHRLGHVRDQIARLTPANANGNTVSARTVALIEETTTQLQGKERHSDLQNGGDDRWV